MRSSSIKSLVAAVTVAVALSTIIVPAAEARPRQSRDGQFSRMIQRAKQFFGAIANALPTIPIPDQTQLVSDPEPLPKPTKTTEQK